MNIVEKKVSELIPYANNPRNNEGAVDAVAASIREFGFKVPMVIDGDGVIVAGHTRLLAAKKLGLESVPCVVADDLTEKQLKAFRLADNKTAEIATWDFDKLELEMCDLEDFDMVRFGFDESDGDAENAGMSDDNYEGTVPVEPKAKVGDLYQLGNHRLICGDSTDHEVIDRLMDGELADMVFTDPHYGVAIGDKNEMLNTVQKSGRCTENIKGDTMSEQELYAMLKEAFINVREHCMDDAVYYVTSPQGGSLGLMMLIMMRDAGLEVRHILMWEKNSATFSLGRLDYDYQHEPIFYTWTKSHHNYRGGENRTTVWKYDKPRKCDLHPTMKPVPLVGNAILDGTLEGMIVLDAFGGSGTTIIAAEQTGRCARVVELDPHYVDVIIDRWETFTGKKAVLLNSGDA